MEQHYTARLEQWVYDKKQNILIGECYGDVSGRFPDGALIRTSRLKPMSVQGSTPKEGAIMATLNSTYLLGSKK